MPNYPFRLVEKEYRSNFTSRVKAIDYDSRYYLNDKDAPAEDTQSTQWVEEPQWLTSCQPSMGAPLIYISHGTGTSRTFSQGLGATCSQFAVLGNGQDPTGLYIGMPGKCGRLVLTVSHNAWLNDNPQGYQNLVMQSRSLSSEQWQKGDGSGTLTWGATTGIYAEYIYQLNQWVAPNIVNMTPTLFQSNPFTMWENNGSGHVEFVKDAEWNEWNIGYNAILSPLMTPNFPFQPYHAQMYWLFAGTNLTCATWAGGDLQHTDGRRTSVSALIAEG